MCWVGRWAEVPDSVGVCWSGYLAVSWLGLEGFLPSVGLAPVSLADLGVDEAGPMVIGQALTMGCVWQGVAATNLILQLLLWPGYLLVIAAEDWHVLHWSGPVPLPDNQCVLSWIGFPPSRESFC